LCVDDNELSVFVNATILRGEGYEVVACSDPLQAASIAESEDLDLAILDYEMPVMNGAELAGFCKAANPATKVILFSGCLTIPSRELALADLFVEKSHGVEALLDAIASLLSEKEARTNWASETYNNDAVQH
jgi:CheY-like chemotaxis protein